LAWVGIQGEAVGADWPMGTHGAQGRAPQAGAGVEVEVSNHVISIILEGRPIAWARAEGIRRRFTAHKQKAHREHLAFLIQQAMKEQGIKSFDGAVLMFAYFDYEKNETRIDLHDFYSERCRTKRPDLDNLIKQVCEACQDSGLIADDSQIAIIEAKKYE
jgi:Holliday junction resolvase RusA-like endonuclease